ncbi:hypothetical protein K9L97_03840 [Candidatus Woesearchaeota archaeon]|nr:hypothetical protein [Candidatus Woesearchaeota archaeon]
MYIYNAKNTKLFKERSKEAEKILTNVPVKNCFISGSFLYKKKYNDIDLFVISRTNKKIKLENKKINITFIDFNKLHSLFVHSISKSCISKNVIPLKDLKVTISDYWEIINETIPTIFNDKKKFKKHIRFIILYTEYFKTNKILDSLELYEKINSIKNYKELIQYINEIPSIISKNRKQSYLKRFFYTQAKYYRKFSEYDSTRYLYNLCHMIIKHGKSEYI